MNKRASTALGSATVTLTKDQVILCVLSGYIDEQVVSQSLAETQRYAQLLQAQYRPVYLLIDATKVTTQTSGARSLAKKLGSMGITKLAVCNRNIALGLVIQYLIKSSGVAKYTKVFRSQARAQQWLLQHQELAAETYIVVRTGISLVIMVIALLTLIGWAFDTEILRSWFVGLKSMNPVVAIVLLLQAVALIILKPGKLTKLRRQVVSAIAGASFLFGSGVLLEVFLGLQLHIDDWLFHSQLGSGMLSGLASPRAAFLITLIGVMEFAIITGQRSNWQKYIFHIASVVIFALTLLSIFGYSIGVGDLYGSAGFLPIPLNTAVSILLVAFVLQTVTKPLPIFARAWKYFLRYSYTAIICTLVIILTGVAWRQSQVDQQKTHDTATKEQLAQVLTTIDDKVVGYIDTLRSYRSFFGSSDFVSAKEFGTFFTSSDLSQHYPGFTAISFVRAIPATQRADLEASMRQQADAIFPSYKDFSIFPLNGQNVLYPTTYIEPHTPTTTFGFNLASDATRRLTLEAARDLGDIVASDTIDLNASRADKTLPKRPGFYITIPIYKTTTPPTTVEQRRTNIYGFVNAIFEDKILFSDIFKNTHQDIKFAVTNAANQTLYTYNPGVKNVARYPSAADTVQVAGQTWRIALYAPGQFGVEGASKYTPIFILVGGGIVFVLTAALTVSQTRRRERALALASAMTEDLNNERDTAVVIQQKDEAILSSIGDAVFAIDTKKRIILYNRAAADLVGKSESEVRGKNYQTALQFVSEKTHLLAHHFIDKALAGKRSTMPGGTLLRRLDGTTVPVADSAAPIVNAHGKVEGAVIVFRDITREKELDRLKNEFVSMASHELRTPMGAIRALSSMILAGDYGPVSKNLTEPLTDIRESTLRLVDLVNDLLSVARIEAGRMKFMLDDIDCLQPIERTVRSLAPLGKEKGIKVSFSKQKLPLVQADSEKIMQVLTNLVGNALKFTDKGSIIIGVMPQADKVEVTVTDTGMGIAPQDQARLFGRFQQITSVQEGRPAGTGLGLYISREIIRKMGGELWIKASTVGKGTTFAFTLPLTNTPHAKRIKQERLAEEKLHPDAV